MAHQQQSPPPPLPPPLPQEEFNSHLGIDLVMPNIIKPQMKMRTLNWRRIPKKKVLTQQVSDSPSIKPAPNEQNSTGQSCVSTANSDLSATSETQKQEDEIRNLWFLIAKANKCIKKVQNTNPTGSSGSSKSASKIRDMLESVRRRMAAVTANTESNQSSANYQSHDRKTNDILELIDFEDLESLFCLNNQPHELADSPNFVRRLSMRTNASSDSVISTNSYSNDSSNNDALDDEDKDYLLEIDNILDAKKSLNVNIFLKQLKNPNELVELINHDKHFEIGKERLENLLRLLPDAAEEKKLMRFAPGNRRRRLPVAERFLLQLVDEVSNLKLRIKFMLLREEHCIDLEVVGPELDKIEQAAADIRSSQMLRDILNLVLITGNFLNTGGYAAEAAGFSLDCLSKLSELRSNKPGVYLIHYIAEMALKLDLIDFLARDLVHVEGASRVCVDSIKHGISSMMLKIDDLKTEIEKEAETESESDKLYLLNLLRTLEDIRTNVEFLKHRTVTVLEVARKQLAEYLCEEPTTFNLNQCFLNILTLSQRLKSASEDNERRRQMEGSRSEIRGSNCSLRRAHTINPRLVNTGRSRLSLNSLNSKNSSNFGRYVIEAGSSKRSSLGHAEQEKINMWDLSRATSTVDVCEKGGSRDDLHEGLMKILDNTTKRRVSDCHKGSLFGTYRRLSKTPQTDLI